MFRGFSAILARMTAHICALIKAKNDRALFKLTASKIRAVAAAQKIGDFNLKMRAISCMCYS